MEYGAIIGLLWVGCFACYVGEFVVPVLSQLMLLLSVVSIVVGYKLVNRMRRRCDGGRMQFSEALSFSMSMFFYASIIAAASHMIYLQFMDDGYLFESYEAYMKIPEVKKQMLLMVSQEQIDQVMTGFKNTRPIDLTVNLFFINLIIGVALSVPTALVVSRKRGGEEM